MPKNEHEGRLDCAIRVASEVPTAIYVFPYRYANYKGRQSTPAVLSGSRVSPKLKQTPTPSRDIAFVSDTGTPEKRGCKRGGDSSPSSPASHVSRISG